MAVAAAAKKRRNENGADDPKNVPLAFAPGQKRKVVAKVAKEQNVNADAYTKPNTSKLWPRLGMRRATIRRQRRTPQGRPGRRSRGRCP